MSTEQITIRLPADRVAKLELRSARVWVRGARYAKPGTT
jgi:hypothetical protein